MSEQDSERRGIRPTDGNNNDGGSASSRGSKMEEKYGLRPRTIIKRLQQERVRQEVPKKQSRTKSRPAPLSKYRRKTANARERHRMREINNAFESLRKVLPEAMEFQTSSSSMTKITTLRLAVSYIRALSNVLEDEGDTDLGALENSLQSSLQETIHHTLQNTLHKSMDPAGGMTHLHYQQYAYGQQYVPQLAQGADYCSPSSTTSASSSPSTVRGSLSSTSDFEELLSDDSALLEDNLDVFHDIPTLPEADPFDILLGAEKGGLAFTAHLCS
ncbi:class A basic helix-loop-helix protein 15 [Penaeus vannamei]|uniref:Putative helix-loop-helix protein delilah n=1 Tax=Penaeus vannamei TaxID=6689 RepID=A0A423SS71_PENVA|nr:class A basic helix-loop-helix protein 15-like [Penaeus vannamei]ROT67057.1 putative helix-loop-helix protein delilah [Penaeus vannamei]